MTETEAPWHILWRITSNISLLHRFYSWVLRSTSLSVPSFRMARTLRFAMDTLPELVVTSAFSVPAPVNPGIRAVTLTAQIRDLLRDDVQNPLRTSVRI